MATSDEWPSPEIARFDTNSYKICVDTGASCSMSGDITHFEDLIPVQHQVSGISDKRLQAKGKGTLVFHIQDDKGMTCTIKLKNSLYVPGLPSPLLVPRHWSEQAGDDGTFAIFGNKSCKLYWKQRTHCKTIQYNDATKTPTFFTAPVSITYQAFDAIFEANDATIRNYHVLQFDKQKLTAGDDRAIFDPSEFVADEDLNLKKGNQDVVSLQELQDNEITKEDLLNFDVEALCPFHPQGHHTWGECSLYAKHFGTSKTTDIGSLTLSQDFA